jgi:WG repeat protein
MWGYVNIDNEIIVDFQFDWAKPFHNGMANVEFAGVKFHIDTTGNCVKNCN